MKHYFFTAVILVLGIVLATSACKNREIPPIGDEPSKIEGISDQFKLIQVLRSDKLACVNRPTTLDISPFFGLPDINMPDPMVAVPTISFDANSQSFTFDPLETTAFLPESGSWRFINTNFPDLANEYPEQLGLTDANGQETVFDLLKPIRPVDNTLELEMTKMFDGKPAHGYVFIFERL